MKEFFKKNASIVAALGANVGVTLAKFIGFLLTRSTAMLNESIHSLIDCVNEVTLLYGKNTTISQQVDSYTFGQWLSQDSSSLAVVLSAFGKQLKNFMSPHTQLKCLGCQLLLF